MPFHSKINFLYVCFFSVLEPPSDDETAIFLHGQEKIWKGLINMQSVAKFVTKAYLVSGSFEHLKEVSLAFRLAWCKTFK